MGLPPTRQNGTMRSILFVVIGLAVLAACSPKPANTSGPEKHYAFSGDILSLNPKAQTASINGAAIPGYMDAMTMDYPIKSSAEFKTLHVDEKIKATLNVTASGDDYSLSNIQEQNSGNK